MFLADLARQGIAVEDWRGRLKTRDYSQRWRGQIVTPDRYKRWAEYGLSAFELLLWLVVHHEGTPDGSRGTIESITAFQIGPSAQLPFPGFAYGGLVLGDGTLQLAYDLEVITWSQGDGSPYEIGDVGVYNFQGKAFCIAGNDPTPQQIATLHTIHAALAVASGRALAARSHRDVSGASDTECAGDAMEALLGAL